jgi:ATP-dependent exoDNAse (exonuclease V) alpha subunit
MAKKNFLDIVEEEDNQLLLPNGKLITFNAEQYEGIKKIRIWLKNNQTFFTLMGFSGSGKSSILKKILDEYNFGAIVSAPTHKARKVIENLTDVEGKTLHSLLGLRPDISIDSYNPNDPQFSPIAIPLITNYRLIVVDECSMINFELFNLIKEKVDGSRTKILFVGDPAQIPPVGEKTSPVFVHENVEKHLLTKVERQNNDNPLMSVYDDLRNNLEKHDGGFIRKTAINSLNEGVIFTVDKGVFRDRVIDMFKSNEFKKDSDYYKGIAWRNKTVMDSNKIIRTAIFGDNADIVEMNDLVMGYRTITNERQYYNIIENSADYHIVSKSAIEENKYGIKGFNVKIREDLSKKRFKYDDVFIVNSNDFENLHNYAEQHDMYRDMAKSNKKLWSKYYEFRRNNLIMVSIDKFRNGMYRSTYDTISKDLDYSYFITAHKAQGSTYQNVAVIESDISMNRNIYEKNQILYVAMSRPEKTCLILTTRIDS